MSTVPRVAESLDDLRVGQTIQTIDPKDPDAWTITDDAEIQAHAEDIKAGYLVVILSEPAPEPVTVSREAFDRLAEAIESTYGPKYPGDPGSMLEAARALVDEVRA